jgi:membrane fusion protein (multidrug efflux system)
VGDTLVPIGGLVQPNSTQPLTTIVPLDPIWVRFKIAESGYISWARNKNKTLADGASLTLIMSDNTEFPFKGRIEDSLNQIDSKTGTLEMQASFPNPKHTLLPGQFGRVRVQVDNRDNAIVIPQKAVQQMQSMQLVYTVGADNKVAMQPVTTGYRFGNQWVIEQGLHPGERVIVEGLLKVRQGLMVNPLPYNPSENSASRKNGE